MVAAALRADGVGPGDRVAAWLPNTLEAIVVMLGAASVGAVVSTCSPDFGADGVLDRFGQIGPTVLVAADGYTYGGKGFDRRDELVRLVQGLPGLARVVVVPFLSDDPDLAPVAQAVEPPSCPSPSGANRTGAPSRPTSRSASTTRGTCCSARERPGAQVHRAPRWRRAAAHLKEQRPAPGPGPGDRAAYFTTCGWMMWNWWPRCRRPEPRQCSTRAIRFHPGPERLWKLVEEESLSFLGCVGQVPRGRRAVRSRAEPGRRAVEPAHARLDRIAAVARVLRVVCTGRWRRVSGPTDCTWRRSRVHRPVRLLRDRRSDPPGVRR